MKTGLVLEGGALRTIFSAGVCDAFLDGGLPLPDYTVGVSAGIAYGESCGGSACGSGSSGRNRYAGRSRRLRRPVPRKYRGLKDGTAGPPC
ncbi:patatin-like phospholipase family protein [uncultured Oscillibacter sp.]|uniref:patatin-like phospholipase family protein n=1 Tax=uncultured Oscillibacter sp. TaxID=876091 RepID=UPI00345C56AD